MENAVAEQQRCGDAIEEGGRSIGKTLREMVNIVFIL